MTDRDPVVGTYLAQEPFVTRDWLADLVEERLRDPACRHVLITADAGMGKSSFLAWLTTRFPLAPYYFVRLDSLTPHGSADATHLLVSVGRQLAAACPEAMAGQPLRIEVSQRAGRVDAGGSVVGVRAARLVANPFRRTDITVHQHTGRGGGDRVAVEVGELVDSEWLLDIPTLQRLALLDPAAELAARDPAARIVLLLDGLDELRHQPTSPRWTILDWLANCPDLPSNVRVVATSRPDPALLRAYRLRQRARLREVAVVPEHDHVRRDLAGFVARLARDPALRDGLRERGVDLATIAAAAARRANGNFLYLVSWARAVRFAATSGWWDERLVGGTVLPEDLAELYALFVTMLHSARADRWEAAHWPVLRVLAVGRAPLTARQVAALAGVPERTAVLALADMPHVLRATGDRFALFHLSFAEYLQSEAARVTVPEFWIDPAVTNRELAAALVERHGADWADDYAVANVVPHLVAALTGEQDAADHAWSARTLAGLLADPAFVARSCAVAGVARTLVGFAEAYLAIRPHDAGAADGLPPVLARHALRDPGDRVDVDSLHAALGYRREFAGFYDALLALLADREVVAAHTPEGADADALWADHAEVRVHRLRTTGRVEEAAALLDAVAGFRGEASRARYERGYLHFLHGRVDEALDALTESVELARLAGNEAGAWMSTLVRDQIALYAGRADVPAYAALLQEALAFFTARSGAHGDRWLMNVHNQLLTLGLLTGDAELAERERDILRGDEWTARERPWLVLLWEARAAVAAGDWPLAVERYETILGPDALDGPPPEVEGVAWNLLDYGRALAGVGRRDEAVTAWRQVLRCSDATAAWPWKPRAAALLTAADPAPATGAP
ncbi:MAG TPA: hypothetical protein VGD67_07325 [Pseudonocardiaceae bacterium]